MVVPDTFPAEVLVDVADQRAKGFAPVSTPTNYLMNLVHQVVVAMAGAATPTRIWNVGLGITDTKSSSEGAKL